MGSRLRGNDGEALLACCHISPHASAIRKSKRVVLLGWNRIYFLPDPHYGGLRNRFIPKTAVLT